ncbi:MAG: SPOR domain-containing protein [Prevotella sp.]|nr:SPOR domain-containing protein [Candidatus Prevotella equi]
MIELSRHIEILLLENDCVIVPGFGGFMAHHKPAEYVAEEGMFYPPQRTLGFNPQLTLNDSLLVQSYVESYDISYPEAVRRIEEEVEEVKQMLAIEGKYEFHGIGTVTLKADEHFDFEPCTAGLLTPALYALNTYAFDLIKKEDKPATIVVPVSNINETVDAEINTEEEELEFDVEDNEGSINISVKTLRNILAAAMILLLFIFTSTPAGIGSSNVSLCSVIDTELISSLIKDKTNIFNTINNDKVNATEDSVSNIENVDIVSIPADTTIIKTAEKEKAAADRFAIVLASKVSKAGAEEFVATLKKEGLNDANIFERGTMRKVVYGNFKSEAEAHEVLRQLRSSKEIFAEAWVSKI